MTESTPLKKTALHPLHGKLGARLVEFGGWEMPVQYTGIVEEHRAVREAAGIFDISHMGEFFINGVGVLSFLNGLLTNDAAKLAVGQGQYTLMLNEEGGVIDDLIVYRLHETEFLLVVNAAKIDEDDAWIRKTMPPSGVSFYNRSAAFSAVALQGPRALEIAYALFGPAWDVPKRHEITSPTWNCQPILAARTGYTGEDGLELFFSNEIAEGFFSALLAVGQPLGLKPCGLGARDTLRLESCYPLNGNDLSPQHTPLAAGLGAFVSLTKTETFPGKEILEQEKHAGSTEKLVAFRLTEKGPPPRPHYPIFCGNDRVGEVTSGTASPTLGCGIGMGYVAAAVAKPGTILHVEVRGTRVPVEVVKKPFYKRAA
jgi:aminomethyltransferase